MLYFLLRCTDPPPFPLGVYVVVFRSFVYCNLRNRKGVAATTLFCGILCVMRNVSISDEIWMRVQEKILNTAKSEDKPTAHMYVDVMIQSRVATPRWQ